MHAWHRRNAIRSIMAIFLATVVGRQAAAHHAVLRFSLEEMVVTADRVFVGRSVAMSPVFEPIAQGRMAVTHYTFDVEQVLKGDLPARFTYTQLGHPPRPARKGQPSSHGRLVQRGIMLHGAADFAVGERLLILLAPNHMNGRLTYPIGLDQGAFVLSDDGTGETLARNNLNNLGLFTAPFNGTAANRARPSIVRPDDAEPLAAATAISDAARGLARRRGALPLKPLLELIERIHAAHGGTRGRIVSSRIGGQP